MFRASILRPMSSACRLSYAFSLQTQRAMPLVSLVSRSRCVGLTSSIAARCLHSESNDSRSGLARWVTLQGMTASVSRASQSLNELTGYSNIELQKKRIEEQEAIVQVATQAVATAKIEYDRSISQRSSSQREVNELLQRKASWHQADLERFTSLFRSDHTNALHEEASKQALERAEMSLEEARSSLSSMILTRYHEEQIWSDKIRRASTWGTWLLMAFNVILFVFVQLALEPWKRRRLVASFEDRLRHVVQEGAGSSQVKPVNTAGAAAQQVSEEFLTAADTSDSPFQHELVGERPEESFLTDADHAFASAAFEHGVRQDPRSDKESSLSREMLLRERLQHYLTLLRVQGLSLVQSLCSHTAQLYQWSFNSKPSNVPMEDITTACMASVMIGIAIGLIAAP